MKPLRRLCVALVFALALTNSVFAGEIDTGIAPPPPPRTATTNGQIETTVIEQTKTDSSEATTIDSATEIALNLIQSVLSLF